jgi:hypothetical protein
MQAIQNYKVAEALSERIGSQKKIINELLLKKNEVDYKKVNMIIEEIKKEFNLTGVIDIIFGIDIRNSKVLPERKDCIELILSPMFMKENLEFLNIIYNKLTSNKKYICNNWSIVKYKPWNPETLENINITYKNEDKTKKIITHDDIEYYSFNQDSDNLDKSNKSNYYEKINIILFIRDNVKKYMLKKHVISGNDVYIPTDTSLLTLLDATIGEYNMLNIINHMEICLKSTEISVEKLPLKHLCEKIKMINTVIDTTNKIYNCSRCGYSNTQVKLIKCKCSQVFYCDKKCKDAHIDIHEKFCNSDHTTTDSVSSSSFTDSSTASSSASFTDSSSTSASSASFTDSSASSSDFTSTFTDSTSTASSNFTASSTSSTTASTDSTSTASSSS